MPDEVAVFIDLENLRYGMLNNHGQEPDILSVVEQAKKYGRPSIMRAYADFTEHPPELNRQLQVAGVEAINIPVKRSLYTKSGKQVERVKNAADMVLALDAITEALDADNNNKKKIFFLVSGDRDYVRLVTQLRNRFGQRVIIAGVPGSIATDLVTAAGEQDPIQVPPRESVEMDVLKKAVVAMVKKGPAPLSYWSLRIIDQWSQDERHKIPGSAKERRDAIGDLLQEKVLVRQEVDHEQRGRITETTLDETRARDLGYID